MASWGVSAPGWLQDLAPTGVSLFEEDEILVLEFSGELLLGEVTRHPGRLSPSRRTRVCGGRRHGNVRLLPPPPPPP
ncbi:hypothetical protein E2562_033257 [Oryza meyeriana var. granulata]|uniref:Uncharacterized protein n=1 Tax=Oryza meyeriana var. granulata TaxID=110450 RepID=A0A6G1F0Z9_9ORYZ|nr:hypothetical protein E2562_033257 [Oryza meyeriana var. granulata]